MKTKITNIDIDFDEITKRIQKVKEVDTKVLTNWKLEDSLNTDDEKTRKVLAYGPGFGKTVKLRQFAANPKNQEKGILIACSTIEQCNELAKDIIADYLINHCDKVRSEEDLLRELPERLLYVYTSGNNIADIMNIEKEINVNVGRTISKYLGTFEVLITTHKSLINEPISMLTNSYSDRLDGSDPRRTYLLIDEFPIGGRHLNTTLRNYYAIENIVAKSYQGKIKNKYHKAEIMWDIIDGKYGNNVLQKSLVEIVNESANVKNSNDIRNYRGLTDIQLASDVYDSNISTNSFDKSPTHSILNFPMKHIVIFDGTGDLIINDSKTWEVELEYQRDIVANKFVIVPFDIKRNNKDVSLDIIEQQNKKILATVKSIIAENDRLLIVGWKSTDNSKKYDVIYTTYTDEIIQRSINLMDYILRNLTSTEYDKIMTTHYQSGKTKGTNEFINCDSILLLGNFYIPNNVISKENSYIDSNTTAEFRAVSEMIQATYRTKARVGERINIYLTEDWSNDTIDKYVERGRIKYDWTNYKSLNNTPITKYIRPSIMERMNKIIEKGSVEGNVVNIHIDELSKIVPRKRKLNSYYKSTVETFLENNLILKIIW